MTEVNRARKPRRAPVNARELWTDKKSLTDPRPASEPKNATGGCFHERSSLRISIRQLRIRDSNDEHCVRRFALH